MALAGAAAVLVGALLSPPVVSFGIAAGAAVAWCWLLESRRDA